MQIEKKDLEKSQLEIKIKLSWEEFKPYIKKAIEKISKQVKIEGFRPGKVPYEILKQKIGEMTILEETARFAIDKTIIEAIKSIEDRDPIGQPQVDIIKLAPENPFEYKIILSVLPKIEIGPYKELKIKAEKIEVTEKEVEAMIEKIRETKASEVIAEREIKNGDKVLLDVEMFVDNIPIEGGQSKNVAIIVGKEYFVAGFSQKIIGAKKNDTRNFSLLFPSDHSQKNLAGRQVEFKVSVNEVFDRIIPEVNDDLAKSFQSKNLNDLKNNIKKSIEQEKKQINEDKIENEILEKIVKKSKFDDIPEILIQNETEKMMDELKHHIESQGGKFEEYLSSVKKSRNEMVLELLPKAMERVKNSLLIKSLAEKENITVSEDEVLQKRQELLDRYAGYKKVEAHIKEPNYKNYLKNIISSAKVLKKLKEWNVEN